MQTWQLFIILKQPVPISVTVFSNLTKLTNYLLIFTIKLYERKTLYLYKMTKASRNFSVLNSNCKTVENGTFDYQLLKCSVLGWRSVFRVRFSSSDCTELNKEFAFPCEILNFTFCNNELANIFLLLLMLVEY